MLLESVNEVGAINFSDKYLISRKANESAQWIVTQQIFKFLMSTFYSPSTVLGTRGTVVNKINKNLALG